MSFWTVKIQSIWNYLLLGTGVAQQSVPQTGEQWVSDLAGPFRLGASHQLFSLGFLMLQPSAWIGNIHSKPPLKTVRLDPVLTLPCRILSHPYWWAFNCLPPSLVSVSLQAFTSVSLSLYACLSPKRSLNLELLGSPNKLPTLELAPF